MMPVLDLEFGDLKAAFSDVGAMLFDEVSGVSLPTSRDFIWSDLIFVGRDCGEAVELFLHCVHRAFDGCRQRPVVVDFEKRLSAVLKRNRQSGASPVFLSCLRSEICLRLPVTRRLGDAVDIGFLINVYGLLHGKAHAGYLVDVSDSGVGYRSFRHAFLVLALRARTFFVRGKGVRPIEASTAELGVLEAYLGLSNCGRPQMERRAFLALSDLVTEMAQSTLTLPMVSQLPPLD